MSSMMAGFDPELAQATAPEPDAQGSPKGAGGVTVGDIVDAAGRVLTDVGRGVTYSIPAAARGAANAVSELGGAAASLLEGLASTVEDTSETGASILRGAAAGPDAVYRGGKWARDLIPEPESVTGKGIEAIAQFLVGFGLWGRALRSLRLGKETTGAAANVIARDMLAGATAFDPYEERLSNLLKEVPALEGPILEYLAANPNDSEAEARFKAALENGGLGAAAEGLFWSVKALGLIRRGKVDDAEEAAEFVASRLPYTKTITTETLNVSVRENRWLRASVTEGLMRDFEAFRETRNTARTTSSESERTTTTVTGERGGPRSPEINYQTPDAAAPAKITFTPDEAAEIAVAWARNRMDPDMLSRDPDVGPMWRNLDRVETTDDVVAFMRTLEKSIEAAYEVSRAKGVKLADEEAAAADFATSAAHIITTNPSQAALFRDALIAERGSLKAAGHRALAFLATTHRLHHEAAELADEIIRINAGAASASRKHEVYEKFLTRLNLLANLDPISLGLASQMGQNLSMLRAIRRLSEYKDPNVGGAAAGFPDGPEGLKFRTRHSQTSRTTESETFAEKIGIRASEASLWEAAIEGGESFIINLAYRVRTVQKAGPGSLRRAVKAAFENPETAMDDIASVWQSSILTAIPTHVLNISTNAFRAVAQEPAERVLTRLLDGEPLLAAREGWNYYVGMMTGLREAVSYAADAFRRGESVLDPGRSAYGERQVRGLKASTFGEDEGLVGDALINGLGELVRLNGRVVAFEDEFFKRLAFRAAVQADALRDGVHKGFTGQGLKNYIQGRLNAAFDRATGMARDEEALSAARYVTLTGDFGMDLVGRFGAWLDQARRRFPALVFFTPFVRTPANILSEFMVYNPASAVTAPLIFRERSRLFQEISAGGDTARRALARVAVASALSLLAADMVLSGAVVGGSLRDPQTGRATGGMGMVPYSIRVTDREGNEQYIQISRLDPYSYPFMVLATAKEILDRSQGDLRVQEQFSELATAVVLGMASALADKSYAQGLLNLATAISEGNAQKIVQGIAAGFVPGIHRDLESFLQGNPYMRDAQTILEAMKARSTGVYSLDPRYTVLGEPIPVPSALGAGAAFLPEEFWHVASPFRATFVYGSDTVTKELLRLMQVHKNAFLPPPHTLADGAINLRDYRTPDGSRTAYARYQELIGSVRDRGMNLREALADLFKSEEYRRATDGTVDLDGSKLLLVQATLRGYRQLALGELLKEFPEIERALQEREALKGRIRDTGLPKQDNGPEGLIEAIKRLAQ